MIDVKRKGKRGTVLLGMLILMPVCAYLLFLGWLALGPKTENIQQPSYSVFYLKDELGIDRDAYTVLHEQDSHGGFHGDGLYAVALDCAGHMEEIQMLIADWHELPLPENLELMLYGGEKDGVRYGYNLAEKTGIPQMENGCYFFNNRHSKAAGSRDDDIFGKYSFNLSLAIFDRDQDILYFLCYDT